MMIWGIETENIEAMKSALDNGLDINQKDKVGQTFIMRSALAGKEESFKYLFNRGADISIGEQNGYTPIHGAAFSGRGRIVEFLIRNKSPFDEQHNDGYSPIFRACWGTEPRFTEAVKVFLDYGVSPFSLSKDGFDLLQSAHKNPSTQELIKQQRKTYLAREAEIKSQQQVIEQLKQNIDKIEL